MHVVKRKIIKNAENQSTSSHFMVLFPADIELYFEIYFCSLNVKYTSSFLLEIFWLIANWTKYIYFKYVLEVKNWSTLYVTKHTSLTVLVKSKKKKKKKRKKEKKNENTLTYIENIILQRCFKEFLNFYWAAAFLLLTFLFLSWKLEYLASLIKFIAVISTYKSRVSLTRGQG